jgi:putative transposase
VRRTWAPVGATPVLTGFGRHRDKTSVIAALSVSPVRRQLGLSFRTDAHDYLGNTDVADFVRQVLRQLRGPVMVVWDRGSNHRGEPIRELLRRYGRLSIAELPSYSPQLNPVECLWSYLKHGKLANFVPDNVVHLDDVVVEHLCETLVNRRLLRRLWEGSDLPFPSPFSQPEGQ